MAFEFNGPVNEVVKRLPSVQRSELFDYAEQIDRNSLGLIADAQGGLIQDEVDVLKAVVPRLINGYTFECLEAAEGHGFERLTPAEAMDRIRQTKEIMRRFSLGWREGKVRNAVIGFVGIRGTLVPASVSSEKASTLAAVSRYVRT